MPVFTKRETDAAAALSRALLDLLAAMEEGHAERHPPPKSPERRSGWGVPPAGVAVSPALLTAHEAAKYLGVSPGTVFNLSVPRGRLPVVRIGTCVRYSVKDLDAAIEKMRVKPEAASA